MTQLEKRINLLESQTRINSLLKIIHKYNNAPEYIRVKNYRVMVHNIRLLNQYCRGIKWTVSQDKTIKP